jgi:hypothetical protein
MQFFYDGQIRRYLIQTIRALSNFVVKYGDGTLVRIPVMYGDMDRQAASILRQNSENAITAAPRIAVYITGLELDRDRLSDSTYVGKLHVRERDIHNGEYTQGQGKNYTVERLMPTPFKLTMKADIWSSNTEQKLQILEQILVLFNPSLELQTTDNYVDWASLSVLHLTGTNWSSRQVPVGADSPIDIATLTFETPIWISPPVKIKHLGVVTNIITSIYKDASTYKDAYIDGLGHALGDTSSDLSNLLTRFSITAADYVIAVYGGQIVLLDTNRLPASGDEYDAIPIYTESTKNWQELFDKYPGKFVAGSSTIFLKQSDSTEVVGTIAINPLDPSKIDVNWDSDTYPRENGIDSQGNIENVDVDYDVNNSLRSSPVGSPGNFDAIINPLNTGPNDAKLLAKYGALITGRRYLLIEDIGHIDNIDGADAWKGLDDSELIANANDIVEWDGNRWNVVFSSDQNSSVIVYQTNIYTGIQYMWNGVSWIKSFEGEYRPGRWRIEL